LVVLVQNDALSGITGKSTKLKQARAEVQEEVTAYRQQCENECKTQEEEACTGR